MKHILITGGAGFIGSNLISRLIEDSSLKITCIDNLDSFYNPRTKKENIRPFIDRPNFKFLQLDIRDFRQLKFELSKKIDVIIHLAAKVGIEQSLLNPGAYTEVNIGGTQNLLELAKRLNCQQFIFASSSSVYGINPSIPWREDESVLMPISPYASTKISGELLSHVYSHLYNIRFIGLRFFSVYGPKQRPDLVIHRFTKLISEGKAITLYGDGKTKRDYTFIDDVVSGIISTLDYSSSQYEIINLGNNVTVELRQLIKILEKVLGKKAKINQLPERAGDAPVTFADIRKAQRLLNYQPKTSLLDGIQIFVDWFKNQYK